VVQDTGGQTVNLGAAVPAHQIGGEDLAGLVERSVVEINDAQVLANELGPLGVGGQLEGERAKGRVHGGSRTDRGPHDVLQVVIAQLGRSVGRAIGLGESAMRLLNDGVGIGAVDSISSVAKSTQISRKRTRTHTSAGGSHLSRWL
jgi:hypothetical protein